MKINNVVILALTAATLLSGCGGGDGGNSDGNNGTSSATELEGTWVSVCKNLEGNPSPDEFYQDAETFSGNTWSDVNIFYTDSACSIPIADVSTWTSSGTFVIGNAITTSSGWSAKEVDMIMLKKNGVAVKTKITGYSIFSISKGTLYSGKVTPENDGSSAAKRPVDLDFTKLYTKS